MNEYPVVNPHRRYRVVTIPEQLVRYKDVSPGAKLVYGRLERYAGLRGKAFPHTATLAEEVGLGERQTREYLKELRDVGLISVAREFGKGYLYTFHEPPFMVDDSIVGESRANATAFKSKEPEPLIGGMPPDSPNRRDAAAANRRDAAAMHPYSSEESHMKSNIPLAPLPESEPLPEPPAGVDLEDVLILHRRAKGSKKPSAPDLRATTEWMADLGAEPGEMYAAMQAFLEDDYWREQKYPIAAFRKHYSKYCQIAQERPAPPPPPATIADLPIVPQRRSQPAKPLVPGATPDDTDAFIAEWNAGPCEALRVRVVSIELRQALRSSLSNPKFRENWATLLQKAHTLRAQPGKEWLTLSLLLKGEKWARLLNGDYDWSPNAKPAPGAGTDALDRLIAASQQKAKAKEKTNRANN